MKTTIFALFFMLVFISISVKLFETDTLGELKSTSISKVGDSDELFRLSNSAREKNLEWDNCLYTVAIEKSTDMFRRDYFSHEDPETGNIKTWDNIKKRCGNYKYAGENLARGFGTKEDIFKALMESPKHKENIVDKNYQHSAVGCYRNICTQLFIKY